MGVPNGSPIFYTHKMKLKLAMYRASRVIKDVRYWPGQTYRRIKRLAEYAPVIWKNEDWDGGYIVDLLTYKVSRQRKRWQKMLKDPHCYICHEGMDRDIERMLVVEKLLARHSDDFYEMEGAPEPGTMNWDPCTIPGMEDHKQLRFDLTPEQETENERLVREYLARYPNDVRRTLKYIAKNDMDPAGTSQASLRLWTAYNRNQRALDLAMDILKWRIPYWWD